MMRNAASFLGMVVLLMLWGCHGHNPLRPKSGGRPYEVVVVGDVDGVVAPLLSVDMEGLPQREPWFDVRVADRETFRHSGRSMRNVVEVDFDSAATALTVLRYERDVYAEPQLVVHVISPSRGRLAAEMPGLAPRLRALFHHAERSREMAFLASHHAPVAARLVDSLFAAQMWMPADMGATMCAEGFLWASNDAAEGMRNICVYRIASADPARFIEQRDSVMAQHVKGETDRMHMTTVAPSVTFQREGGKQEWLARGLWEMVGDAMGGPFVARVMPSQDGTAHVAEAFVYAPEGLKRNLLLRTEASLFTFRPLP